MSDPVRDEHFACKSKVPYHSTAEARLQMKAMIKHGRGREKRRTKDMNVYRCAYCGWFHIGHRPKKTKWKRVRPQSKR